MVASLAAAGPLVAQPRLDFVDVAGRDWPANAAEKAASAGPFADCRPAAAPLVLDGYEVGLCYETAEGEVGEAKAGVWESRESGLLWFFSPENAEVLIKVLNGCAINNHRWVFVAPVTDVAFNLQVVAPGGRRWTHRNMLGSLAETKADTSAFPCPEASGLRHWLTSASVGGREGEWRTASFPTSGSGGPSISVAGNAAIVPGGTTEVVVSAGEPLTGVLLTDDVSAAGYYEVPVAAGAERVRVRLQFSQDLPAEVPMLNLVGRGSSNLIGPPAPHRFDVVDVGTGELQVNLSWNSAADLDLHVVEPSGEEIYFGDRTSNSGGELDLDSNAACRRDNVRNENVTWEESAPVGEYTVRVNHWSNCGVGSTDYTVRVNYGGESSVFSGTFTGSGSRGGRGSGTTITVFRVPG